MAGPYEGYPGIEKASVKTRCWAAKASCLDALKQGKDLALMESLIEDFLQDEQYEMVKGMQDALAEFKANPQLSLF